MDDKFDVAVIDKTTRKVKSIVGKDMFYDAGYYSAIQRRNTYLNRVSRAYCVEIVPAGVFNNGDFVPEVDYFEKERL